MAMAEWVENRNNQLEVSNLRKFKGGDGTEL